MAQSRQPWIRRSPSAPEVQNHSFSGLSCGRIRMVKPVPGRTSTSTPCPKRGSLELVGGKAETVRSLSSRGGVPFRDARSGP